MLDICQHHLHRRTHPPSWHHIPLSTPPPKSVDRKQPIQTAPSTGHKAAHLLF
jgi:hypothetical protein